MTSHLRRTSVLFTFIIHESFEPPTCYRLENHPVPGQAQNYVVVVERPPGDYSNVYGAPPEAATKGTRNEYSVNKEKVNNLISLLSDIKLDLLADCPMGLDGTSYELLIPRDGYGVRFKWWVSLPKGWEPLNEIFSVLDSPVISPLENSGYRLRRAQGDIV